MRLYKHAKIHHPHHFLHPYTILPLKSAQHKALEKALTRILYNNMYTNWCIVHIVVLVNGFGLIVQGKLMTVWIINILFQDMVESCTHANVCGIIICTHTHTELDPFFCPRQLSKHLQSHTSPVISGRLYRHSQGHCHPTSSTVEKANPSLNIKWPWTSDDLQ